MNETIEFYQSKLQFETDAADLFASLENGDDVMVVDARRPEAFAKEHIPGAINLPHRDMNEASTSTLDPKFTYVVYCDGIGCNASTKGALTLSRLGFKVKELMGGIQWWKFDGYATHGSQGVNTGTKLSCFC